MQNANPLFPSADGQPEDKGYVLPQQAKKVEPLTEAEKAKAGTDSAVNLIREKLARIYADEPNAVTEATEAKAVRPRSKHQQFMYQLSTSGKSLAAIQTDWHTYYTSLPDNEKHEVWQEFYEANNVAQQHRHTSPNRQPAHSIPVRASYHVTKPQGIFVSRAAELL